MNDYISREAFILSQCHNCDGYCDKVRCECLTCKSEHRCDMIRDLADFPAADVAPVVRCRDCKNYVASEDVNGEFMCVLDADWCEEDGCYYGFTSYPPSDFYCANGAKMRGGEE